MLPLKNVAEGTMEVGLWDKDVAGWNDCLGTRSENLYDHMVKDCKHSKRLYSETEILMEMDFHTEHSSWLNLDRINAG